MTVPPAVRRATPPVPLRRVVLPTEHGGWAFLGEPVLLGLALAPSGAGGLIALSAVAAFLARQPLRLFVADRRKGNRYPRTVLAERAFAVLAALAAFAAAGAVAIARGPVAIALAAIVPLGAAALAFDLGRRSRELAAELVAALALGGVASAIALAGGWARSPSFALWGLLAARALPAILYVRARLRLDRGESAHAGLAHAAHAVALGGVALLALSGLVTQLTIPAYLLLAARAAYGLSPVRPRWRTAMLGVSEIVFGLLTLFAIWLGTAGGRQ